MRLVGAALLVCLAWANAAEYDLARPGYRYEFPRDHFAHPGFRTEWWYYTGNVWTAGGRRFGFELTFFRHGLGQGGDDGVWSLDNVYLAHLALSDIEGRRFLHTERVNRAGPGIAGAREGRIWNGNWRVVWSGGDRQSLEAVAEEFTIRFDLSPVKPPVIHGVGGVSAKAPGEGRASHYISFPRLAAKGAVEVGGESFAVTGEVWMDHEFFTHQLTPEQVGWDWFSIQLEDSTELMLYQLRRADGSIDPYSAGTYIDAQGRARHLRAEEFVLAPGSRKWKKYPIEWTVRVPSLGLDLRAATPLENQELTGESRFAPVYWEGAVDFTGTRRGQPLRGHGYIEMTGYERPVNLGERSGR